jgi:hypothetical protein
MSRQKRTRGAVRGPALFVGVGAQAGKEDASTLSARQHKTLINDFGLLDHIITHPSCIHYFTCCCCYSTICCTASPAAPRSKPVQPENGAVTTMGGAGEQACHTVIPVLIICYLFLLAGSRDQWRKEWRVVLST